MPDAARLWQVRKRETKHSGHLYINKDRSVLRASQGHLSPEDGTPHVHQKMKKALLTLGSTFSCQQVKRPVGFCQHSPHQKVKALETWLTRISEPRDPGEQEEPFGNNRKRGKACLGKQGKGFSLVHDNRKRWRMHECNGESHSMSQETHYLDIVFWWCLSFQWKMQLQWVKNKPGIFFGFVRERSWRSPGTGMKPTNVSEQTECSVFKDGLHDEDKYQLVASPDR